MLETFRKMLNDCLRIGLENNIYSLKPLGTKAYPVLRRYQVPSYYKQTVVSRASGFLKARKKSMKRGISPKTPHSKSHSLILYQGFWIKDSSVEIPLYCHPNGSKNHRKCISIQLNTHTQALINQTDVRIRCIKLTDSALSITYSKEVADIETVDRIAVDRNLRNLTVGNDRMIMQYDLSKAVEIAETTTSVLRSFKRNDVRIKKKLYRKYGTRRKNRVHQLLHSVSKDVVSQAKEKRQAIVLEDITNINSMYRKGNKHSKYSRRLMNSWPHAIMKSQLVYKAQWAGVPIIQLSRCETRNTSNLCPQCGERLQEAGRGDSKHHRQLRCEVCKRWLDRDVVAVMNQSLKGLLRFGSSKGVANEAMSRNAEIQPLILQVDATKLGRKSSGTTSLCMMQ